MIVSFDLCLMNEVEKSVCDFLIKGALGGVSKIWLFLELPNLGGL